AGRGVGFREVRCGPAAEREVAGGVLVRSTRRLHDAVQGKELLGDDSSHGPFCPRVQALRASQSYTFRRGLHDGNPGMAVTRSAWPTWRRACTTIIAKLSSRLYVTKPESGEVM